VQPRVLADIGLQKGNVFMAQTVNIAIILRTLQVNPQAAVCPLDPSLLDFRRPLLSLLLAFLRPLLNLTPPPKVFNPPKMHLNLILPKQQLQRPFTQLHSQRQQMPPKNPREPHV
jgi:hypothetical protein